LFGNRTGFPWNDIIEFKASAADFLSFGNNNTVVGAKWKVDDKGKGNMMLK
jgi:hypothetical protein